MTPDLLGQPAAEAVARPPFDTTSQDHALLATDPSVAESPPLYLSARSIRC